MAVKERWANDDGLNVKFGLAINEKAHAGVVNKGGGVWELHMVFDFNDAQVSAANAGAGFDKSSDGVILDQFSGFQGFIPANSLVTRSTLFALTDWADSSGTMDFDIGTYQRDGTAIDADGLHSAILEAELDAGDLHVGDGNQIGADVGANDAYIGVVDTAAATLSSGTARLVVEFIPPHPIPTVT